MDEVRKNTPSHNNKSSSINDYRNAFISFFGSFGPGIQPTLLYNISQFVTFSARLVFYKKVNYYHAVMNVLKRNKLVYIKLRQRLFGSSRNGFSIHILKASPDFSIMNISKTGTNGICFVPPMFTLTLVESPSL